MADTKWSQLPSATPGNSDDVVGLHSGNNARFSIANIVAAVRNGLASIFVPLTRTINSKALSTDISLDSSDIDYDNTGSGLSATDVQEAIDELAQGGGGTTVIANPSGAATDALTKLQVENTIYSVSGGGSGASEAQLGYPETGTTASRNYSAGEYICWNGLTYTADTNIALGATLSASGGNKNLTECVGGGLNHISGTILSGMKISTFTGTLDRTSATNVYNTGITWTNYAMLSFSMFGATPASYPWIIDSVSNSGIKTLSINNSGTFTIEKTAAQVGGTNRFYITVIHD